MKRALPQRCRLDDICAEQKQCSPANRICERTEANAAIFALTDDALNDENHPLHDRAINNYNFVEIPATSKISYNSLKPAIKNVPVLAVVTKRR